jgi:hypothetical protein
MRITTILFLTFCFQIGGCLQMKKFSNGVVADTQKNFSSHKNFIRQIAFEGILTKRVLCQKCTMNMYQVEIKLLEISEKPDFGKSQYPPYYIFEDADRLTISVSKEFFETAKENDIIIKYSGSRMLKLGDRSVSYLSEDENEWF